MSLKTIILCLILSLQFSCATHGNSSNDGLNHLYDYRWSRPSVPDQVLSTELIVSELKDVDVVFFGELHGHPGIHLAQMELLEGLYQNRPQLTLSLEQFERDTQTVLDQYLQREIGETYMLNKARAWDNYKSSYRPLVEFARNWDLPVIAANAPKQMVVCVGRDGLDVLKLYSQADRKHVSKNIDVSDGKYQDKFMKLMRHDSAHSSHGSEESNKIMQAALQKQYAAQALRDSTMSESIARHLTNNPGRQVLHLNGNFHSSDFLGTVERLHKQMPTLKIAVVHPVTTIEKREFDENAPPGTFLITVQPVPEKFVQSKHRMEWLNNIVKGRMEGRKDCPEKS